MTVFEFIELLKKMKQDAVIGYTFSGQIFDITIDDIHQTKDGLILIGDDQYYHAYYKETEL